MTNIICDALAGCVLLSQNKFIKSEAWNRMGLWTPPPPRTFGINYDTAWRKYQTDTTSWLWKSVLARCIPQHSAFSLSWECKSSFCLYLILGMQEFILPLAYLGNARVHHLSPTLDCNVFHFPSEPTLAQHRDFLRTLVVHSNCTEENEASLVYFVSLHRGTPSPFPRAFFLHKIQTCKELERMLFIMTEANMQIFGVISFFKLQNNV